MNYNKEEIIKELKELEELYNLYNNAEYNYISKRIYNAYNIIKYLFGEKYTNE